MTNRHPRPRRNYFVVVMNTAILFAGALSLLDCA